MNNILINAKSKRKQDKAYETAYALRNGEKFDFSTLKTKGEYDSVVVGAGIGGLSSALFYQNKFGKGKRILVLNNYDNFDNHARSRTIISYGRERNLPITKTFIFQ